MDSLTYYKTQSSFTDPRSYQELYDALPRTAEELSAVVDGLMLDYRDIYKYPIVNERLLTMHSRTAEAIIESMLSWNKEPLTETRPMPDRFLAGTCDYANLFVSMARNAGIPARKRAGFSEGESCERPEYYDENEKKWKMLDISGMYPGEFIPAADIWLGWRCGEVDAKKFTAAMDSGATLILANLMLDIAAMNKRELLEWDRYSWSLRPLDEFSDRALQTLDKAAELLLAGEDGLEELWALYENEEGIQVPHIVRCYPPKTPPHKAEVPV